MGRVIKARTESARLRKLGGEIEAARAELMATMAATAQLRAQAKKEIIDLSLHIAEKVIGKAVSLDPSLLEAIYQDALSATGTLQPLSMRVHPEARSASNLDTLVKESDVVLIDDPGIHRAGCKIAYGAAEIDATLETALDALRAAMTGQDRD